MSSLSGDEIKRQTLGLFAQYVPSRSTRLRNKIVTLNLGLAHRIAAREHGRRRLPLEDLQQLAAIGLTKAVERYDPANGAAFSSFAVPYIRGEIQHFCRDHEEPVKVPRRWRELADAVRDTHRRMVAAGRDGVSPVAIAASMGLDECQWREIDAATQPIRPVTLDREEAQELAAPEQSPHQELSEHLANFLQGLEPVPRAIVVEHYWGGMDVGVIAARRGLTKAATEELLQLSLSALKSFYANTDTDYPCAS